MRKEREKEGGRRNEHKYQSEKGERKGGGGEGDEKGVRVRGIRKESGRR